MTAVADRPTSLEEPGTIDLGRPGGQGAGDDGPPPPLRTGRVAAAALLSVGGAAWVTGAMFRGGLTPEVLALLGALIGVGLVALSTREGMRAASWAVLPVAALTGAVAVAPEASGGTANLPGLVGDALRSGGLMSPPVAFEPGWRFLLVVLFALVGSSAAGLALSLRKPRLSVATPAVITVAAVLLQPEASMTGAGIAALLTVGALAVAMGADPVDSAGSTGFERQRLVRGGALLVALAVGVVGVSQADFLFPDTEQDRTVPPQRPPVPPPEPDRVLFRVLEGDKGPWRVGTLDVYDGEAFLLPPVDPDRMVEVPANGVIGPALEGQQTETAQLEVVDLRFRTLPMPSAIVAVVGIDGDAEHDPRTDTIQLLEARPPQGMRYQVTSVVPPDGRTLADTPPADPAVLAAGGELPPAPNEVLTILAEAPENPFDRLQFVRQQLYNRVVAAGAGEPVEVPPTRVAAMLQDGAEATPYEITAAEVLLARWAGVPARMGFGYFGGDEADGVRELRPKHGSAFLEAYFEGHGYVPIVGVPPRAKSSLSDEQRNEDPTVVPTDELGMVLFIPVKLQPLELLYQTIRYWVTVMVPVLALIAVLVAAYPAGVKAARSLRRRRWARRRGPLARIWVTYCEMRDRALDLNVGDVRHTPVGFLDDVSPDDELAELAWLVTRTMWGDLRRDVREEDADAAEEMSRSVRRRLTAAQPLLNRAAAAISRASLRDPYSDEVPNLWLQFRPVERARSIGRSLRSGGWRARLQPAGVTTLLAVVAVMGLSAFQCTPRQAGLDGATTAVAFPDPLMPDRAAGYGLVREDSVESRIADAGDDALVDAGRVFTIHNGPSVEGSVQVLRFKPEVDARDRRFQESFEEGMSVGRFRTRWHGLARLREVTLAEQRIVLWFPPHANVVEVFVTRAGFDGADPLVRSIVDHQLGLSSVVAPSGPGSTS